MHNLTKSYWAYIVQAQLRASVFLALDNPPKPLPSQNAALRHFMHTAAGMITVNLVQEFLDHFGLGFTSSVFQVEIPLTPHRFYANSNSKS